jgi:hypothetical protein
LIAIARSAPMRRVCVYTAIFGDYDPLREVPAQDVACDYVCFTDNPALLRPKQWQVIHAPILPELHPRMRSKFFKILHDRVFARGRLRFGQSFWKRRFRPRYDDTVWIDGSIQIKSPSFVREFTDHVAGSGWSMFIHPNRRCIYAEAEFSKTMRKYGGQPIDGQMEAYKAEGYAAGNGLIATGLIARSTSADLTAINEMWWDENMRWSYQDQLSLPVVLSRLGKSYDPVQKQLWSNEWFDWIPHRSEL